MLFKILGFRLGVRRTPLPTPVVVGHHYARRLGPDRAQVVTVTEVNGERVHFEEVEAPGLSSAAPRWISRPMFVQQYSPI